MRRRLLPAVIVLLLAVVGVWAWGQGSGPCEGVVFVDPPTVGDTCYEEFQQRNAQE